MWVWFGLVTHVGRVKSKLLRLGYLGEVQAMGYPGSFFGDKASAGHPGQAHPDRSKYLKLISLGPGPHGFWHTYIV